MEHEVHVNLLPGVLGTGSSLLLVSFGTANLSFEVEKPEQLTQWLAFLFKQRDLPHPSSAPVMLEVGRFGPNPVEFRIEGEDMMLVTGVPDRPQEVTVETPLKTGPMELIPSLTIYIPRELLDDLADGLAHEHRQWVEILAA